MKSFLVSFIMFIFAFGTSNLNAENIKRLSDDSKPSLTAAQVTELEKTESEKHPVEGYVGVKTVVDCFDEMSYRYTGGRYQDEEIKFRLRVPNLIQAGAKYPLIIWFHGKGESDDDNKRQLSHMQHTIEYLAGPNSLDFFILATQCPKDNPLWTTSISSEDDKGDAPITIVREIMDAVIEEFPIAPDRISAFGLSSGGAAAWQFVMDSPETFAGLAICSASEPSGEPLINMNVWIFACTGDKGVPISQVRESVARINQQGGSALLTEIVSVAHNSWTVALREKKLVAWLVKQKRKSFLSPPPGAVLVSKTWMQVFLYYGLPLCCMIPFVLIREGLGISRSHK